MPQAALSVGCLNANLQLCLYIHVDTISVVSLLQREYGNRYMYATCTQQHSSFLASVYRMDDEIIKRLLGV